MTRSSRTRSTRGHHASSRSGAESRDDGPLRVRIVGGTLRGRSLKYSGDRRVRPMKDRTREALFNLLGPRVRGLYAWDLFAGTGAMGFEAISRGALGATLIEQHIPTSKLLHDNAAALDVLDQVRIVQASAFHWMKSATEASDVSAPWLVFCCPPYSFYSERLAEMRQILADVHRQLPRGSLLVVEAEVPFDVTQLIAGDWQVREYSPAVLGILSTAGYQESNDATS